MLIAEFGTLAAVLAAAPHHLTRVLGNAAPAEWIVAVAQAMIHAAQTRLASGPQVRVGAELFAYLQLSMANRGMEQMRVLYLNTAMKLLRDEVVAEGDAAHIAVPAARILRRAIEVDATGMILVHNHPAGSAQPSAADIRFTAKLVQACRVHGLELHDHIIVSREGWCTFRQLGLL